MKYITLVFIVFIICVISISNYAVKKTDNKTKLIVASNNNNEIEKAIISYCEFAKVGDYNAVASLFTETPLSYIQYRNKQWEKRSTEDSAKIEVIEKEEEEQKSRGREVVQGMDSADVKIETRFNRKSVTDFFAKEVINKNKMYVKKIEQVFEQDAKARATVIFGVEKNAVYEISYDFFLVENDEKKWQIFKIALPNQKETYPL